MKNTSLLGKTIPALISLSLIITVLVGCTPPETETTTDNLSSANREGFAVYLTKDNVPPDRMEMLSHIEITDSPVIAEENIIWYDAATHEMQLTEEGFVNVTGLGVPTSGKSFVVCLDRGPIYWGAFWTMISSQSFDGITIMQPFETQDPVIQIGLGYPAGIPEKNDPRDSIDLMQRLKDAGKLVNELPTTFIETLPHSMKGYELYSWQEDSEWHYRLITGTNRNKTVDEIISNDSSLTGLVSIHVEGTEAIRSVLSKLPDKEEVFWINRIDAEEVSFGYPDEYSIGILRNYAEICGIELFIPEQVTE